MLVGWAPRRGVADLTRKYVLSFVAVLACAALAIVAHAVLPAQVDEDLLDGFLVQEVGFVAVAVSYFILLYAHCAVVVNANRANLRQGKTRSGLFLGSAFALLYMVGMQEVMLEANAFETWGLDFVAYQTVLGLGDAVPAIILCVTVSVLLGEARHEDRPVHRDALPIVLLFTLVVGTSRLLLSYGGVIDSHVLEYPVPVVAWGFALGCAMGIGYVLVRRACSRAGAVMIYGLGLNWVIFNMFIGLVKSGTMADALTRSILDVVVVAAAMGLAQSVGGERQAA